MVAICSLVLTGGNYTLVPQGNYIFNAPNTQLNPAVNPGGSASTNPKAGEDAWKGSSNQTNGFGSWGTTIVDLSTIAHPGDTIKLKFDFGQDGCGGANGWFVDNIRVFNCPALAHRSFHWEQTMRIRIRMDLSH